MMSALLGGIGERRLASIDRMHDGSVHIYNGSFRFGLKGLYFLKKPGEI
jgi:hypothetical protein